ncbi:MAG: deoxyribodipyrimidine photo-lyase, partial [Spirochaetales bacterium]|nr:deoxyribodipyrimidine photo-lyase [Spirochaetales bacterium]
MEPYISALLEQACVLTGVQTARLQTHQISQPARGAYVLYWMQRAQRAIDNPALELGLALAGQLRLPLLTVFVLTDYPEAVKSHYRFMLEGLVETASQLRDRGIGFAMLQGNPVEMVAELCRDAAVLICDAGRLRIERSWRIRLISTLSDLPIITVETEAVVPPALACPRPAWSAAVLRTRIAAFLPHFLAPSPGPQQTLVDGTALSNTGDSRLLSAWKTMPDPSVSDMLRFQRIAIPAGTTAALKKFADFLANDLARYSQERNDPNAGAESGMSPYLHFGQVSPVTLARMALATDLP